MSDCIEILVADVALVPQLRREQQVFAWGPADPVRYHWGDTAVFREAELPPFLLRSLPASLRSRVPDSTVLTLDADGGAAAWSGRSAEGECPAPGEVLFALLAPQPYWAVFYGVECDDYGRKGRMEVEDVVGLLARSFAGVREGFVAWAEPGPRGAVDRPPLHP